jgi:tetratricopeptide (TPR) repeat protein
LRKLVLILVLAFVLIGVGFVVNRASGPDLGTDSDDAARLYREGDELLNAFKFSAAIETLERALDYDPDFALAVATLAVAHRRSERTTAADSLASRAEKLADAIEDDDRRMLVQLKLATWGLGESKAHFDSLLTHLERSRPNDLDVLLARTERAKREGDDEALEKIWLDVLKRNPNHANAYNQLGYIAFWEGDYERAVSLLQRYAFLAPDLANPHDSLGEILMYMGRYEEAEAEFRKALGKEREYLPSILNLARVYLDRGQLHKGIDLLEKLREMTPGTNYEAKVDELAIGTYYAHQLWDELKNATARYIATFPDRGNSALYRVLRLTASDREEAATAVLDSLLTAWRSIPEYEEDPRVQHKIDSAEAQMKALLCEHKSDPIGAQEQWGKALKLLEDRRPHELVFMREQYARCLLTNDRPKQALEEATKVLQVNPRQLRSLALAAEASIALDRRANARQYVALLDKALVVADEDYPLRERLAELKRELSAERPSS